MDQESLPLSLSAKSDASGAKTKKASASLPPSYDTVINLKPERQAKLLDVPKAELPRLPTNENALAMSFLSEFFEEFGIANQILLGCARAKRSTNQDERVIIKYTPDMSLLREHIPMSEEKRRKGGIENTRFTAILSPRERGVIGFCAERFKEDADRQPLGVLSEFFNFTEIELNQMKQERKTQFKQKEFALHEKLVTLCAKEPLNLNEEDRQVLEYGRLIRKILFICSATARALDTEILLRTKGPGYEEKARGEVKEELNFRRPAAANATPKDSNMIGDLHHESLADDNAVNTHEGQADSCVHVAHKRVLATKRQLGALDGNKLEPISTSKRPKLGGGRYAKFIGSSPLHSDTSTVTFQQPRACAPDQATQVSSTSQHNDRNDALRNNFDFNSNNENHYDFHDFMIPPQPSTAAPRAPQDPQLGNSQQAFKFTKSVGLDGHMSWTIPKRVAEGGETWDNLNLVDITTQLVFENGSAPGPDDFISQSQGQMDFEFAAPEPRMGTTDSAEKQTLPGTNSASYLDIFLHTEHTMANAGFDDVENFEWQKIGQGVAVQFQADTEVQGTETNLDFSLDGVRNFEELFGLDELVDISRNAHSLVQDTITSTRTDNGIEADTLNQTTDPEYDALADNIDTFFADNIDTFFDFDAAGEADPTDTVALSERPTEMFVDRVEEVVQGCALEDKAAERANEALDVCEDFCGAECGFDCVFKTLTQ